MTTQVALPLPDEVCKSRRRLLTGTLAVVFAPLKAVLASEVVATTKNKSTRIDIRDYSGVDGSGRHDDTAQIRRAIQDAVSANDPKKYRSQSPWLGHHVELYFPRGLYTATDVIPIPGTAVITGCGGGTYAGSIIRQATSGKHLFVLGPANDGQSNSTRFDGLMMRAGSPSLTPGTSLITALPGIASNSVYVRNCWFQTPEDYAVSLPQGDDIQIFDCTFDVSAFRSIRLGSKNGVVSNARISRCDFFDIAIGAIDAVNVEGLVISENTGYMRTGDRQKYNAGKLLRAAAYFYNDNPQNSGQAATDVLLTGNRLSDYSGAIQTIHGKLTVTGNIMSHLTGPVLMVVGGSVVKNIIFTSNSISGQFDNRGAINAEGTGVSNSVIALNVFEGDPFDAGSSPILTEIADSRNTGNDLSLGKAHGFTSVRKISSG